MTKRLTSDMQAELIAKRLEHFQDSGTIAAAARISRVLTSTMPVRSSSSTRRRAIARHCSTLMRNRPFSRRLRQQHRPFTHRHSRDQVVNLS